MKKYFLLLFVLSSLSILLLSVNLFLPENETPKLKRIKSTASPKAPREAKKARSDYFLMMLRDPKTGKIPANIAAKEQEFSKMLAAQLRKNGLMNTAASMDWHEAGPNDVGGRTRALAIDIANPNIIIAGGVSGGIWKSTDKGNTWSIKSSANHMLSVSSISQDPRPGFTNIWYYSTGEYDGNTASDRGYTALFYGNGIYKSSDNGESWAVLQGTLSNDPIGFDGLFDFVSKIIVNPQTGTVFTASNQFGISRSTDAGNSFQLVLGRANDHVFSDVTVSENGTLLVAISSPYGGGTTINSPGIYKSINDGVTWTNITPNSFPASHNRTVLAIAPSNQNTAYVYTYTGVTNNNNHEDIRFFKLNLSNNSYIDRSANLPDFGNNYQDYIHTQGGYNMTLAVKPDDENLVVLGASSLFRSFDGFASKPTSSKLGWIGGYWPSASGRYPNLHPDVHSFVFDPQNPAKVWFGHDGGLSYCDNIAATNYTEFLPWQNKNNNYNVTQFYTIAIPPGANDNRIMGGTQDNGTPYFTFNGTTTSTSSDVSSGDGSYCYFGENYAYTSSQKGFVLRTRYNSQGMPDDGIGWSVIHPSNASNQLFINPFIVDPNNENIMYYAAGSTLWRNTSLNSLPANIGNGTTIGWSELSNITIPQGYLISTLAVSKSPEHILYFGASGNGSPKLYRLNNSASSNSNATDISIAGTSGYIHNIAINPDNAEELIVVLSNYNITGLYYSNNGGQSFTAIEGNLEGNNQNPGPSLRSATIIPTNDGTIYLVGTSIGLYSTKTLAGTNTVWVQEGPNIIGNVVVEKIASRTSDNRIVAATHGRGAFVATAGSVAGNPLAALDIQDLVVKARPGELGTSKFILRNNGDAQLNFNITASGQFQLLSGGYKIKTLATPRRSNISFINYAPDAIKPSAVKNNKTNFNKPSSVSGDDIIIYDDGNDNADTYLGFGNKTNFGWANEYILEKNFSLEKFQFFMKSESASSNEIFVAVQDKDHAVVAEGTLNFQTSANGEWFSVDLTNPISFSAGEKFYIFIETKGNNIDYPAGVDDDAVVTGKRYYKSGTDYVNLSSTDFKTHAFLIRPVGTLSGGNRLAINPSGGSIAAGSSQEISITLDASGLGEGNYSGQASIITNGGNITLPLAFIVNNSVDVKDEYSKPESFYLSQNFPNPFNPSTTIKYGLQYSSDVKITIFNSNGEVVAELLNTHQPAGNYQVTWNGKDNKGMLVSSGIYFYRLEAGKYTYARKMLLMK